MQLAVLLIEDDEAILEGVKDGMGFSFPNIVFLGAGELEEGRKLFLKWENSLALVIVDVILLNENGFDFFRWVQDSQRTFKGLLACFTACRVLLEDLRKVGCTRVLYKPCALEEIEDQVRDAVLHFRSEREVGWHE